MQHPSKDENQLTAPATEDGGYPPTVWSMYRENIVPIIVMVSLMAALVGKLPGIGWLTLPAVITGGIFMASIVPSLALEYRADRAHDRAHPEAAEEVSR